MMTVLSDSPGVNSLGSSFSFSPSVGLPWSPYTFSPNHTTFSASSPSAPSPPMCFTSSSYSPSGLSPSFSASSLSFVNSKEFTPIRNYHRSSVSPSYSFMEVPETALRGSRKMSHFIKTTEEEGAKRRLPKKLQRSSFLNNRWSPKLPIKLQRPPTPININSFYSSSSASSSLPRPYLPSLGVSSSSNATSSNTSPENIRIFIKNSKERKMTSESLSVLNSSHQPPFPLTKHGGQKMGRSMESQREITPHCRSNSSTNLRFSSPYSSIRNSDHSLRIRSSSINSCELLDFLREEKKASSKGNFDVVGSSGRWSVEGNQAGHLRSSSPFYLSQQRKENNGGRTVAGMNNTCINKRGFPPPLNQPLSSFSKTIRQQISRSDSELPPLLSASSSSSLLSFSPSSLISSSSSSLSPSLSMPLSLPSYFLPHQSSPSPSLSSSSPSLSSIVSQSYSPVSTFTSPYSPLPPPHQVFRVSCRTPTPCYGNIKYVERSQPTLSPDEEEYYHHIHDSYTHPPDNHMYHEFNLNPYDINRLPSTIITEVANGLREPRTSSFCSVNNNSSPLWLYPPRAAGSPQTPPDHHISHEFNFNPHDSSRLSSSATTKVVKSLREPQTSSFSCSSNTNSSSVSLCSLHAAGSPQNPLDHHISHEFNFNPDDSNRLSSSVTTEVVKSLREPRTSSFSCSSNTNSSSVSLSPLRAAGSSHNPPDHHISHEFNFNPDDSNRLSSLVTTEVVKSLREPRTSSFSCSSNTNSSSVSLSPLRAAGSSHNPPDHHISHEFNFNPDDSSRLSSSATTEVVKGLREPPTSSFSRSSNNSSSSVSLCPLHAAGSAQTPIDHRISHELNFNPRDSSRLSSSATTEVVKGLQEPWTSSFCSSSNSSSSSVSLCPLHAAASPQTPPDHHTSHEFNFNPDDSNRLSSSATTEVTKGLREPRTSSFCSVNNNSSPLWLYPPRAAGSPQTPPDHHISHEFNFNPDDSSRLSSSATTEVVKSLREPQTSSFSCSSNNSSSSVSLCTVHASGSPLNYFDDGEADDYYAEGNLISRPSSTKKNGGQNSKTVRKGGKRNGKEGEDEKEQEDEKEGEEEKVKRETKEEDALLTTPTMTKTILYDRLYQHAQDIIQNPSLIAYPPILQDQSSTNILQSGAQQIISNSSYSSCLSSTSSLSTSTSSSSYSSSDSSVSSAATASSTHPRGTAAASPQRPPSTSSPVVLNCKQTKQERSLVLACIQRLGWQCHEQTFLKGNIIWLGGAVPDYEHRQYSRTCQVVNRLPGVWDYTKKQMMSHLMRLHHQLFPKEFNFFPPSWSLPDERCEVEELLSNGNREAYIIKPDGGAMGHGLQLVSRLSDIDPTILKGDGHYIVQKYIKNPFLLNKRKFDFRIYVLLTSVLKKPRVFISKLGMARFCTEEYSAPTRKNLSNSYMHLTNYSINKENNEKFVRSANVHDKSNSKRLLEDVLEDLKSAGVDTEDVWNQIKVITAKTVLCLTPWLNLRYRYVYRGKLASERSRCFQLLGLDILLDSNGKAWLLEVNSNPSLRIDYFENKFTGIDLVIESLLDRYIKEPVLTEALRIVNEQLIEPRRRFLNNRTASGEHRGTKGAKVSASRSITKEGTTKTDQATSQKKTSALRTICQPKPVFTKPSQKATKRNGCLSSSASSSTVACQYSDNAIIRPLSLRNIHWSRANGTMLEDLSREGEIVKMSRSESSALDAKPRSVTPSPRRQSGSPCKSLPSVKSSPTERKRAAFQIRNAAEKYTLSSNDEPSLMVPKGLEKNCRSTEAPTAVVAAVSRSNASKNSCSTGSSSSSSSNCVDRGRGRKKSISKSSYNKRLLPLEENHSLAVPLKATGMFTGTPTSEVAPTSSLISLPSTCSQYEAEAKVTASDNSGIPPVTSLKSSCSPNASRLKRHGFRLGPKSAQNPSSRPLLQGASKSPSVKDTLRIRLPPDALKISREINNPMQGRKPLCIRAMSSSSSFLKTSSSKVATSQTLHETPCKASVKDTAPSKSGRLPIIKKPRQNSRQSLSSSSQMGNISVSLDSTISSSSSSSSSIKQSSSSNNLFGRLDSIPITALATAPEMSSEDPLERISYLQSVKAACETQRRKQSGISTKKVADKIAFAIPPQPLLSPRRSPLLSPRRSPLLSPRRSPLLSPRRSPLLSPRRSPLLSPRCNATERFQTPLVDDGRHCTQPVKGPEERPELELVSDLGDAASRSIVTEYSTSDSKCYVEGTTERTPSIISTGGKESNTLNESDDSEEEDYVRWVRTLFINPSNKYMKLSDVEYDDYGLEFVDEEVTEKEKKKNYGNVTEEDSKFPGSDKEASKTLDSPRSYSDIVPSEATVSTEIPSTPRAVPTSPISSSTNSTEASLISSLFVSSSPLQMMGIEQASTSSATCDEGGFELSSDAVDSLSTSELLKYMNSLNVLGLRFSRYPRYHTFPDRLVSLSPCNNTLSRMGLSNATSGMGRNSNIVILGKPPLNTMLASSNVSTANGWGSVSSSISSGPWWHPPIDGRHNMHTPAYTTVNKEVLKPLSGSAFPRSCWVDLSPTTEELSISFSSLTKCQKLFERLINFPQCLGLDRANWLEICRVCRVTDAIRKVKVPIFPIRKRNSNQNFHHLRGTGALLSAAVYRPTLFKELMVAQQLSGAGRLPRDASLTSLSGISDRHYLSSNQRNSQSRGNSASVYGRIQNRSQAACCSSRAPSQETASTSKFTTCSTTATSTSGAAVTASKSAMSNVTSQDNLAPLQSLQVLDGVNSIPTTVTTTTMSPSAGVSNVPPDDVFVRLYTSANKSESASFSAVSTENLTSSAVSTENVSPKLSTPAATPPRVPQFRMQKLLQYERYRRMSGVDLEQLWVVHMYKLRKTHYDARGLGMFEFWLLLEEVALLCFPFLPRKVQKEEVLPEIEIKKSQEGKQRTSASRSNTKLPIAFCSFASETSSTLSKPVSLSPSSLPPQIPSTSSLPPQIPSTSSLPPQIPSTSSLPPQIPSTSSLPPQIPSTSSLPPQIPSTSSLPPQIPSTSSLPPQIPLTSSLPPQIPFTSSLPPQIASTSSLPPQIPLTSSLPPQVPLTSSLPSQVPSTSSLPSQVPSRSSLPSRVPSSSEATLPRLFTSTSASFSTVKPSSSSIPLAKPSPTPSSPSSSFSTNLPHAQISRGLGASSSRHFTSSFVHSQQFSTNCSHIQPHVHTGSLSTAAYSGTSSASTVTRSLSPPCVFPDLSRRSCGYSPLPQLPRDAAFNEGLEGKIQVAAFDELFGHTAASSSQQQQPPSRSLSLPLLTTACPSDPPSSKMHTAKEAKIAEEKSSAATDLSSPPQPQNDQQRPEKLVKKSPRPPPLQPRDEIEETLKTSPSPTNVLKSQVGLPRCISSSSSASSPSRTLATTTLTPSWSISSVDRTFSFNATTSFETPDELPAWHQNLCASWPGIREFIEKEISAEDRLEAVNRFANFLKNKLDQRVVGNA